MAAVTLRDREGSFTGDVKHRRWSHGGHSLPGPQPDPGDAPKATTSMSTAVATVEPVFTEPEHLALAGSWLATPA